MVMGAGEVSWLEAVPFAFPGGSPSGSLNGPSGSALRFRTSYSGGAAPDSHRSSVIPRTLQVVAIISTTAREMAQGKPSAGGQDTGREAKRPRGEE